MEKIPDQIPQIPKNDGENTPNFYEISEKRRELRKAVNELGEKGTIFDKH